PEEVAGDDVVDRAGVPQVDARVRAAEDVALAEVAGAVGVGADKVAGAVVDGDAGLHQQWRLAGVGLVEAAAEAAVARRVDAEEVAGDHVAAAAGEQDAGTAVLRLQEAVDDQPADGAVARADDQAVIARGIGGRQAGAGQLDE